MVGFRSRISPLHVGLAIPWIVAVIAGRLPIRDNSFLWHVRAGSLQIDQGSVLVADPFSFTRAGEAWRTQSWLLELGYARLDDAFSLGLRPMVGYRRGPPDLGRSHADVWPG